MDWKFATDLNPVVIYSAVLSTLVAGWQVYIHFRSGPRLRVSVGANRKLVGHGHVDPKTYIVVNATNVGTADTTIEGVGMYAYENQWKRFRRQQSQSFYIVMTSAPGNVVPHVLEPGKKFMGLANQTEDVVKLSHEKLVYIGVSHSMAKKDILVRLEPIEEPKE